VRKAGGGALLFIFMLVLVDSIGFGIILPVLPRLIMQLTGVGIDRAARYGGWLSFVYALMQFFCAPVLGNLSDRFGRRPVLLYAVLSLGVDYLIMGFAPTIGWLFLGRTIAGVAGASFTPAYAYVADVTPPERRAQNFGLMSAAFGIGFILGPAVGGLLGSLGPRAPFFAAGALALANFAFGCFALPESLPLEKRRPFQWARANPLGQFRIFRADYLLVIEEQLDGCIRSGSEHEGRFLGHRHAGAQSEHLAIELEAGFHVLHNQIGCQFLDLHKLSSNL